MDIPITLNSEHSLQVLDSAPDGQPGTFSLSAYP